MPVPFRHRLHIGPYRTPRFSYAQKVDCLARGELRITKLSNGRIPWPMGLGAGGKPTIVLYRDLAKAVRRESNAAICYWWGVGPSTVSTWRKALGVQAPNEGDRRVLADHGRSPKGRKAVLAMHATARDPARRAKIAAAKLGKPRPPHVAKLLRTMNLGRKHTLEFRKWLSENHKRNGIRPPKAGRPWEPWEDELLRTLPVAEVMNRTSRTDYAVRCRRHNLRLPDARRREERPGR